MSQTRRSARGDRLPYAKKSLPARSSPRKGLPPLRRSPRKSVNPDAASPDGQAHLPRYTNYIAFVEDPRLKAPFNVLPGNNIKNIQSKEAIDNSYLNKARRKRAYDVAFTPLYTFPCRIFAKCEASRSLVSLHAVVSHLNDEFAMLVKCKIPLEEAYSTLMDNYSNKVQEGIVYETGELTDPAARQKYPPDTAEESAGDHRNDFERSTESDRLSERSLYSPERTPDQEEEVKIEIII